MVHSNVRQKMTAPEVISLIASVASVVLAIVAIWLSITFFKMTSEAAKSTEKAAEGISSSVEKLEKLFDKLYADTFSMMRETVTDMRKHIWQAPDTTKVSEEPSHVNDEIVSQVQKLITKDELASEDKDKLREKLEKSFERMVLAHETRDDSTDDRRIAKLIGTLGRVKVEKLAELFEGNTEAVAMSLFRLRNRGEVTWNGLSNTLSSDTTVSLMSDPSCQLGEQNLRDAVHSVVSNTPSTDGWQFLGSLGGLLRKRYGVIDYTEYGYNSLYRFLQADSRFEFQERGEEGGAKSIYVRVKQEAGLEAGLEDDSQA